LYKTHPLARSTVAGAFDFGRSYRLAGICKTPPMRLGILTRHDGRFTPRRGGRDAGICSGDSPVATQGYIVAAGDIAEFLRRLLPRTVLLLRDLFGPPRRAAQAARRFFELCSNYRKSSASRDERHRQISRPAHHAGFKNAHADRYKTANRHASRLAPGDERRIDC
jgi:hypothetical protein